MTTLRELLDDDAGRALDGNAAIESWAYGTEEECPEPRTAHDPGAAHLGPCSTCHGTGKVRTPGLVERVLDDCGQVGDWSPSLTTRTALAEALRQELGSE